jgi:hypothetical protein
VRAPVASDEVSPRKDAALSLPNGNQSYGIQCRPLVVVVSIVVVVIAAAVLMTLLLQVVRGTGINRGMEFDNMRKMAIGLAAIPRLGKLRTWFHQGLRIVVSLVLILITTVVVQVVIASPPSAALTRSASSGYGVQANPRV